SLLCLLAALAVLPFAPAQPAPEPTAPRLLIAFASVRERRAPPYPRIYFYEHDGKADGKLVGSIDSISGGENKTRSDMHTSLSGDGRFCAFSGQFGVQDGGRIEIWDRQEKKLLPLPSVNESSNVHQVTPSLSADGKLVAFAAWARPGSTPRWGVFLHDTTT